MALDSKLSLGSMLVIVVGLASKTYHVNVGIPKGSEIIAEFG